MARRLAIASLALLLTACYGGSSAPTPGDMTDVLGDLAANGLTMTDTVAGDTGCSDGSLADNARRLEMAFAPDGQSYTVYLFRWRRDADFTAAGPAFDRCAEAYRQAHPSAPFDTVDVSPWRAFGPAWTPQLREALEQALAGAAAGR